jgi:hypothetical protein
MEAILQNLAQPANLLLMRNCTWTLSNFCRGKPQPPLQKLLPALPALTHLLAKSNDPDTIVDACWALSYISDGDNDRILAVVQQNIVPTLITMMDSDQTNQIIPALRTIGNIVSGCDQCTQAVVNGGFLPAAAQLLSHAKKGIRKETCWALSNIAAGSHGQLQTLMSCPGVVPGILEALSASSEWEVRISSCVYLCILCMSVCISPFSPEHKLTHAPPPLRPRLTGTQGGCLGGE